MATMFVRHQVNDYRNWKRVYDGLADIRKKAGVTRASVHREAEDADTIIVTHQFNDLKTARAFAGSADLKAGMAEAGVAGKPIFWFTEDIEQTSY